MKTKNHYGQEFWESHISSWKSSATSIREYCRTNDLNSNTFYSWNNKLKTPGPRKLKTKKPSFIPVIVSKEIKSTAVNSSNSFPDAKWLGQFAAELIRSLR